ASIITDTAAVCGDAVTLLAVETPYFGYWLSDTSVTYIVDSTSNPVLATTTVFDPTPHTLTWNVNNSDVCFSSDEIEIRFLEPIPDGGNVAGPDQILFYNFETVMEGTDPIIGFAIWERLSGTGDISNPDDPTTSITNLEFGTSYYQYSINNGVCDPVTDTMSIDVRPVNQTNGFSPNGDGINDLFVINGIENTRGNRLVVFDNWGDVVFEANDYQNDWDGKKRNGADLPSDTYYFILTIPELEPGEYSGYLILKR
ncbi:MAG: hypothetical protein DRI54_06600, partial [Bacteroidetes bacterium]